MVERLFLAVPRGCLWFVIVVFPDHTHLLFFVLLCYMHVCLLMPCGHLCYRADLLAFVCDVLLLRYHFPIGIRGQVWSLIVSIPDLCPLSYFISLLRQGLSEPEFYGDLVYRLKKIVGLFSAVH